MSRTVYLHVGIAKTGTTYLQRTLFANRRQLERHGTRYPGPEPAAHFFGSLDLRGARFQGHVYDRVEGAWGRLVDQADAFGGNTLISHETLAHANVEQIDRAVHSFATADVRVVITCRDLARQIPAVWQEKVKNRGEVGFDEFLAQISAGWGRRNRLHGGFWRAQDVGALVQRWGEAVGMNQVRLVTVPPVGSDRMELWRRFAQATDLPDLGYTFASGENPSLGVAEAELLRRLNPLLKDSLDWPQYDARIKRRLAETILGPLDSQGRLRLPPSYRAEVVAITQASVDYLAESGVTVVGDLRDLEPSPAEEAGRQPDQLEDAELLDAALRVIAVLASEPLHVPGAPYERGLRSYLAGSSVKDAARLLWSQVRRRTARTGGQ
ncbi:MAG: hypothetical protein QOI06_1033 [Nocardioidaceae bacterium]|nr:hypothetical protein [Nocardioidaceae bacterium]